MPVTWENTYENSSGHLELIISFIYIRSHHSDHIRWNSVIAYGFCIRILLFIDPPACTVVMCGSDELPAHALIILWVSV